MKVGEESKEYYVHEQLLVHYSGYFRGALGSSTFKEAEDRVVTLTDVKPRAFETFTAFMYAKSLSPDKDPDWHAVWASVPPVETDQSIHCSRLLYSYVFADRFMVEDMRKVVVDLSYQRFLPLMTEPMFRYESITFVFENLPADDPYLEFLVDVQCAYWSPAMDEDEDQADIDALTTDFLYRVMKRMSETRSNPQSAIRQRSYYDRGLKEEAGSIARE